MFRVKLYDQNETHFATFDFPELPRVGDIVEIGFPNEQLVKSFLVEHVIHQMVQLPTHRTAVIEGVAVQIENDPPWCWAYRLHGELVEPKKEEPPCLCSKTPDEVKCPQHGHQSGGRDICPVCQESYLGYCPQGQYCTDDKCRYVS